MPIYAYRCEQCGHVQDVMQKLADAPLTVCPACGADAFRKQLTAPAFQLKGSGWYVTDFRDGNKGKAGKADDAPADSAKGDATKGDATKGDAAKGDAAKGDAGKGDGGKASAPAAGTGTSAPAGAASGSGAGSGSGTGAGATPATGGKAA